MALDLTQVRKIVVGDSFSMCKHYVIGSSYRQPGGLHELVALKQNPDNSQLIDIYLRQKDKPSFKWKTINVDTVLEVEYDSVFN